MEPLTYKACDSQIDEGDFIAEMIKELLEVGEKPCNIVVIYRANRQSRAIEDAIRGRSIPYQIVGTSGFWSRFYPRLVVSAFMLAAATIYQISDAALAKAIKHTIDKPNRFLGSKTADKAIYFNPSDPIYGLDRCKLSVRQKPSRDAFQKAILDARQELKEGNDFAITVRNLCDNLGITQFLKDAPSEDADTPDSNGDGQLPILLEVLDAMADYGEDVQGFINYVTEQMESKVTSDEIGVDNGKVTLMTIHRSKGLQWPIVFVPGFAEDMLPHKMADESSMEEERRIAYVAITRAERVLIMTSPTTEPTNKDSRSGISRFVGEAGLG